MASSYVVNTGVVTLTAAATKSLVLLNPATDGLKITEWGISFDNVATNAEPIQIDLYRVSTIGTPTGTAGVQSPLDPNTAASTVTSLTALTAEPTAVTVLFSYYVAPNSGLFVIQYPLGREPAAPNGGARVGLRYTTVTGVTPKAIAYVTFEEQ